MKSLFSEDYLNELSKFVFSKMNKDETLVLNFIGEKSQFLRFNRAKVRQTGMVEDGQLGIQILKSTSQGLKKASQGTTLTGDRTIDEGRLKDCLKHLENTLNEIPHDPLAEALPEGSTSRFTSSGTVLKPEQVVDEVIAPMQKLDSAGLYSSGVQIRMMKSSTGISHWFETTNFQVDYSLYTENQRAVKKLYAGQNWNTSRFRDSLSEAADQLKLMQLPAKKIPRGKYRVYLAPDALSEIISMFSWGCVGEMAIQQGESPLRKIRNGEARFSEHFSLVEDFNLALSPRFNHEGELAPESLTVIDKGKLVSSLVSRRTAKEFNLKSTCAPLSESLRSSKMVAGSLKHSDVLKTLHDGLYLSNLHYLNWSDQHCGRITGMTRFACLLVENGKLVAPIESMRFDDTIFNLLGDNLEAVTAESETMPSTSTYDFRSLSGYQVPGSIVRDMNLTL